MLFISRQIFPCKLLSTRIRASLILASPLYLARIRVRVPAHLSGHGHNMAMAVANFGLTQNIASMAYWYKIF